MAGFSPYIATIDGIRIQLHWTFLLLLLLVFFLNTYYFVLFVLLFICVLIHEMMHSITSRRNGVPVNKIVLYPFGGGSVLDLERMTPDAEFRISIVGPLASMMLAAAFGMLAIYAPEGILRYTVQNLFLLNAFLGIFNLLPWLPLDGGRALRSYLQRTRSNLAATRIAVRTSNVVTSLFILGTFAYALLWPGYSFSYREFIVVWDVVIALFIRDGARQELQGAYIKEKTSGILAGHAVTKDYVLVSKDLTISQLYEVVLRRHRHMVIFRDGAAFKSLSTESMRTLSRIPVERGKRIAELGSRLPQVAYSTRLYSAIERLQMDGEPMAAVTKNGRLLGMLTLQHAESVIMLYLSHTAQPSSAT